MGEALRRLADPSAAAHDPPPAEKAPATKPPATKGTPGVHGEVRHASPPTHRPEGQHGQPAAMTPPARSPTPTIRGR